MTIVVRGEPVCTFCLTNLVAMADRAGLSELRIVDTAGANGAGQVLTWTRGMKKFDPQPITGPR